MTNRDPNDISTVTERSFGRALKLLKNPESVWAQVAGESGGLVEAFVPYSIVIGLVPMILGAVLGSLFGSILILFTGMPLHFGHVISTGVAEYLYMVLGTLMVAKIIELSAPSFGLKPSFLLSIRVMVYASTPSYIISLVGWVPLLGWLAHLGAFYWSVRLLIQGCGIVLKQSKTPQVAVDAEEPVREPALR